MEKLSLADARRMTLAAQGFNVERPKKVTMQHLQREVTRLSLLQIDSVNVLVRAHYAPLFARLGSYDTSLLDRAASHQPQRVFEYWGHAASLIDIELQPALRMRMAANKAKPWSWLRRVEKEHPGLVNKVLAEVESSPTPLTAREINHNEVRRKDHWGWNWSSVKIALEWLWTIGELTPAGRNSQFERLYAPTHRVIPKEIFAAQTPSVEQSHKILVERAAAAMGVGTVRCFSDWFRTAAAPTRQAIAELEADEILIPVDISGWGKAWRHVVASKPRTSNARALVCPFDPLVFERKRLEALFGVHYRIGIYTPAAERVHGYYVYLFVLDDQIVARVDLKADRKAGVLKVQTCFITEAATISPERIVTLELTQMASWLGLSSIEVAQVGDLATDLRKAMG